jgi:hypothetical protein
MSRIAAKRPKERSSSNHKYASKTAGIDVIRHVAFSRRDETATDTGR